MDNVDTYRTVSNLALAGLVAHVYGERFDGADSLGDFFFEDVYVGSFHAHARIFLDGQTTRDCPHVAAAVGYIREAVSPRGWAYVEA